MTNNSKPTVGEAIIRLAEQMKSIEYKIDELKRDVSDIRDHYVRKEEFNTVKNIVFGMVGFILLAFIGAVSLSIGLRG